MIRWLTGQPDRRSCQLGLQRSPCSYYVGGDNEVIIGHHLEIQFCRDIVFDLLIKITVNFQIKAEIRHSFVVYLNVQAIYLGRLTGLRSHQSKHLLMLVKWSCLRHVRNVGKNVSKTEFDEYSIDLLSTNLEVQMMRNFYR